MKTGSIHNDDNPVSLRLTGARDAAHEAAAFGEEIRRVMMAMSEGQRYAFMRRLKAVIADIEAEPAPRSGSKTVIATDAPVDQTTATAPEFFVQRLRRGERVLDLGCCHGALSAALVEGAKVKLTGVDWSQRALARARALSLAQGLSPAPKFLAADVTNARIAGPFDVVIASAVLNTIPGRVRCLQMWISWYGPRAILLRVTKKVVERSQLMQEIRWAGLRPESILEAGGDWYAEAVSWRRND